MKTDKSSLARSHSKSSNARLTLLCLFTGIAFALVWVGLIFLGLDKVPTALAWAVTAVGGLVKFAR